MRTVQGLNIILSEKKNFLSLYLVKKSKHVSQHVWNWHVQELSKVIQAQLLPLQLPGSVPILLQNLLSVLWFQPGRVRGGNFLLHTVTTGGNVSKQQSGKSISCVRLWCRDVEMFVIFNQVCLLPILCDRNRMRQGHNPQLASPPTHPGHRHICQKVKSGYLWLWWSAVPVSPLCTSLTSHWLSILRWKVFEWLTPVSWRAWQTPADRCRLAVSAGPLPWPAGSLQMNSLWWVRPGLWAQRTGDNRGTSVSANRCNHGLRLMWPIEWLIWLLWYWEPCAVSLSTCRGFPSQGHSSETQNVGVYSAQVVRSN